MSANEFIVKLKAADSENSVTDLHKAFSEYKNILVKLQPKLKSTFALNVFCTLCRNIEKVPSWQNGIDCKVLLAFSIECVNDAQNLPKDDQIKCLAGIYHMHKFMIKGKDAPPNYLLKLSYIAFDNKELLSEYCKTYWNILADRIAYMERLKSEKVSIIKLLPKLTEDFSKLIGIYETVALFRTVLVFIVKKLYSLFNDNYSANLNDTYKAIFKTILEKDSRSEFTSLKDQVIFELFEKFNDILYVVTENSQKSFKDSAFYVIVKTAISLFGHREDIHHCIQNFHINLLSNLFNGNSELMYIEDILSSIMLSCETTEKLGYKKAMQLFYPYLNQLIRLYLERKLTDSTSKELNIRAQENSLKLIQFLMNKLRNCQQIVKCDNCPIKVGLHDSLRLSLIVKTIVNNSANQGLALKAILPIYYNIVIEQYNILDELAKLKCKNSEKCLKKAQTDVHNTAILLNKINEYEFSIQLFDVYLKYEMQYYDKETSQKNISRALYNKAICELDYKSYSSSLYSAYISYLLSYDALTSEKYISLVIDIKAKSLKSNSEDDVDDSEFQTKTVVFALEKALKEPLYDYYTTYFKNLDIVQYLKHEFYVYSKLWPSIQPIAGIWNALYENKSNGAIDVLLEIVIKTPSIVRSINNDTYTAIIRHLNDNLVFDTDERKLVKCALLCLNSDLNLMEANLKYNWKVTDLVDPDQVIVNRTILQEYEAINGAIDAVKILTQLSTDFNKMKPTPLMIEAVKILDVYVCMLLYLYHLAPALQLAHCLCKLALLIEDRKIYVKNAALILSYATKSNKYLDHLMSTAGGYLTDLTNNEGHVETAIMYVCYAALYSKNTQKLDAAKELIRYAQFLIVHTTARHPQVQLDLATGVLLSVQSQISYEKYYFNIVSGQRSVLSANNIETKWRPRRLRSFLTKYIICLLSVNSSKACRSLSLLRRGRSIALSCMGISSAVCMAELVANITCMEQCDDAQIKINDRLKHILGLQPTNQVQRPSKQIKTKQEDQTIRTDLLETMLDHRFKKTQTSPSVPCDYVPSFRVPNFMCHKNCACYACNTPYATLIACKTASLEASMYFRSNEHEIARNYFEGALKMYSMVNINNLMSPYEMYDSVVLDIVKDNYSKWFVLSNIELLIEATFFELAQGKCNEADDYLIRIHEISQNFDLNIHIKSEILNAMTTAANLRNRYKTVSVTGIEVDMESLRLSPNIEPPKTPEIKACAPPKFEKPKIIVSQDELPQMKRKVSKLKLEDNEEPCSSKEKPKKQDFKIPVPVTKKPVTEILTPISTRSKPKVNDKKTLLDVATPKCNKTQDFSTPRDMETPCKDDVFFTAKTSVKTYSKKNSIKDAIIKNLEQQFKEEVPTTKKITNTSNNDVKSKRSLQRAASPGKMENSSVPKSNNVPVSKTDKIPVPKTGTRSRLRKPVVFSIDKE